MVQLQQAIERMYEDIRLTDELVDEEAMVLLQWGEAEHDRLMTQTPDNETFEDRAKKIRRMMSRMNSFIGKRGDYDTDKAREVMAHFTEGAYELGYPVPASQVDAFLETQANLDNMATLNALLALLSPPEADDPPELTPPHTAGHLPEPPEPETDITILGAEQHDE